MKKDYFTLIQKVRDQEKDAGLKTEKTGNASGVTLYNKNLMIFCVKCSTKVGSFPLPSYLKCKCAHGLREKRQYWSDAWIQIVMNKLYDRIYTAGSMQT